MKNLILQTRRKRLHKNSDIILSLKISQNIEFIAKLCLDEKYFGWNFFPSVRKVRVNRDENHFLGQHKKNIPEGSDSPLPLINPPL